MLWRTFTVTRKNHARSFLRTGAQHGLAVFLCLSSTAPVAFALDGGMDAAMPAPDGGRGGDGGGGATEGGSGGAPDAGRDAGVTDAGQGDGGGTSMPSDSGMPDMTAACSCESASGSGSRKIHLCTGSFDRDVCRAFEFSCELGTKRSARCDEDSRVKLCCDMPARGLYTYLYEDCTHPNCETGFRAQCADFAGEVVLGLCRSPDRPDDPNTELETTSSCSASHVGLGANAMVGLVGSALTLALTRRRRIRRATRHSN